MKLPLLEHPGLYVTANFLSKNPAEPPHPDTVDYVGTGPEPDYAKLGGQLTRIMQTSSEPAASDGHIACLLHENLKLSRREAADMRFWQYLTIVKYPHYVSWRYHDAVLGKTNKNRYTGLLDDNALSRLWWFADLTVDPNGADPYKRTRETASSLEFVKGIVENLFGGNRNLVSSLVNVLFNGNGRPPDALMQKIFVDLNVLLVSVAIDALDEAEVASLVRQLYLNASAGSFAKES